MPAAVSLGIALPSPAQAQTILGNSGTTVDLSTHGGAAGNPFVVYPSTVILSSGNGITGAGSSYTLTNSGVVTGGATSAGIRLQTGSRVTNTTSGAVSGGYYGLHLGSPGQGASFVTNAGVITATTVSRSSSGIYMHDGSITNSTSGSITGAVYGLRLFGVITVTNQGTITGSSQTGVYLEDSGTVTNSGASAIITGGRDGILTNLAAVTVSNSGTITGTADSGIYLGHGGSVTNSGTASKIAGRQEGVKIRTAVGTVSNQGTISATVEAGIYLTAGGTVTNSGTASTITGPVAGVGINGTGTVINEGTMIGSAGYGIKLLSSGSVTNSGTSARITGSQGGVFIGAAGTVNNSGSIAGTANDGVLLGAGGSITNSGTITGPTAIGSSGALSVTNSGLISGNIAAAGRAVTIAGGTGGAVGTLTGQGGGLGTVTALSVTFSGGSLLLNDNITSGTVTNNGALRFSNPLTMTGNYSQGSGGVLEIDLSPSSTNKLTVTGTATLAGTLDVNFAAGNYTAATYDIVHAAGGIGGSFTTLIGGAPSGFTESIGYTATDVDLTLAVYTPPPQNGSTGTSGSDGLTITGSGNTGNTGVISGSNGANGGDGANGGTGGNGGNGGAGVTVSSSGGSVSNIGTISGGNGGAAGLGGGGAAGAGGAGIIGAGLAITNGGTISGGLGGDGVTRDDAIVFTGGVNSLTLQAGSTVIGNVVAFSGADTLALGGGANGSFDVSKIGPTTQYQGFGQFQKTGGGTWTLTGATTSVTPWTIGSGTLNVGADASLGAVSGTLTLSGGTLQYGAGFTSARAVSLGTGGGTFDTNNFNATLSGTISGSGGLVKTGGGTLTLSGANAYTGGTTITSGTLALAPGASLAATGALVLGGGSFNLNGNTQSVASLSGTGGQITLGTGNLTVNQTANTSFSGTISGAGGLVKTGGGTLTLNAANSYSGGTTLNGGVLELGKGASLAQGSALTFNGGTFNLNGNNQTVGSLSGGSGAISLGSGVLTVDQGTTTSFLGAISGSGALIKTGLGLLILDGASSVTGGTTVSSGTLEIGDIGNPGASLAGAVTVASGGQLAGHGTVTGSVNNVTGGVVAPGGSVGTLTVGGNYTQGANSSLQIEVSSLATSRLVVGGTASLGGSALIVPLGSGFVSGTRYTIVTATGGVSGAFASVSSSSPLLAFTLSYDAADVYATLGQLGLSAVGGTRNQRAAAAAFDLASAANGSAYAASLAALDTLSASGVRSTLDRLSGEPYTGLATTALASGDLFTGLIRRQSLAASSDGPSQGQSASGTGNRVQLASLASDWGYDPVPRIDKPWGMWVSGYGQTGGISSDGNAHRLNETISGGVVGVDYKVNPQLRIGMAFGAGNTSFSLNNDGGRGSVDQTQAALYADYDWGAAYLAGQLGVAYGDGRVRRDVSLPGLPAVATGHATDTQALSSVEAGYRLAMPGHVTLTPFAGLSFDTVRQNGLTESGAGALALTVKGGTTNSAKSQLGTRLDGTVPVAGTALATDLSIGWAREYASGARTATVAFSADPAASFQVDGARSKRDSAVLGAGLALPLSAETSVYLRYDGSLDGSSSSHALSGGFRVTW